MSSHGEDLSLAAFWDAVPCADRKAREWLKGPMITTDDLLKGSAVIERLDAAAWWRAAGQAVSKGQFYAGVNAARSATGAGGGARKAATKGKAQGPLTIPFGKYKNRLAIDVREEDPGYWRWMLNDVAWFAAKVRAAGLDDEDSSEDAA